MPCQCGCGAAFFYSMRRQQTAHTYICTRVGGCETTWRRRRRSLAAWTDARIAAVVAVPRVASNHAKRPRTAVTSCAILLRAHATRLCVCVALESRHTACECGRQPLHMCVVVCVVGLGLIYGHLISGISDFARASFVEKRFFVRHTVVSVPYWRRGMADLDQP
jgi:hypothetical protein